MKSNRFIRFFANVKLAVVIVLGLGALIAYGTIVEAQYDMERAHKLVYKSWAMYTVFGVLCTSLISVMIDRWPWQKKHTGFVLAHIGILILLFGSWITQKYGVDGSMIFQIGETSRNIVITEPEINVYASLGDGGYTNLYSGEHDFLLHPLPKDGLKIQAGGHQLEIFEYQPYSMREEKIIASETKTDGPAVRFQMQNPNVNVTEWVIQTAEGREAVQDLGPAKIVLTSKDYDAVGQNVVVLRPEPDGESLNYSIYSSRSPAGVAPRKGKVKAGDTIETGWMGLVMRILKYMPNAKEEVLFHKREKPTPLTQAAIRIRFNGNERWMGLDSVLKFFTDQAVYLVSYGNKRIDLSKVFQDPGFEMRLKKFEVGRYQGTNKAATYQSLVEVPGRGEVLISMNEPLYHQGFTFYQASFQEDPKTGKPTASVLSVNFDPGRWVKYLGSLIICMGTIHLFYFKRRYGKKSAEATT